MSQQKKIVLLRVFMQEFTVSPSLVLRQGIFNTL